MFEAIKTSIQDFVTAQINNKHARVTGLFTNIFKGLAVSKTFNVPTAAFTFEGNLTDEQKGALNGFGLVESNEIKDGFIGSPSFSLLPSIFSMGMIEKRLPPGYISSDAYLAYSYLLKGYNCFSSVVGRMHPSNVFYAVSSIDAQEKGKKVMIPDFGKDAPTTEYKAVYNSGGDTTIKGPVIPLATSWDSTGEVKGRYIDVQNMIEPATGGIFFPYFEGMNLPDKSSIAHIFPSLFFRALADTSEDASKLWGKLRSGIRALSYTSAGMALAHLYTGIRLSTVSMMKISCVLSNGMYQGFVLFGTGTFLLHGIQYKPVTPVELLKELGELNRQDRILGEIVSMLNAPVNADGMPVYLFTKEDINTSRKLTTVWHGLEKALYGTTERGKLVTLVDQLVWSEKFAIPNQATILSFLSFVNGGNDSMIENFPAYTRGGFFMKDSLTARGLSIFGPRAPSMNIAPANDSITFSLPAKKETVDPNLVITDSVRTLRYLVFAVVAVNTAESQWDSLFKSGRLHFYKPRKDKKEFVNNGQYSIRIANSPFFDDAYRHIKERSIHVRAGLATGKRSRANDDSESGPSGMRKKSKKDNESVGLLI